MKNETKHTQKWTARPATNLDGPHIPQTWIVEDAHNGAWIACQVATEEAAKLFAAALDLLAALKDLADGLSARSAKYHSDGQFIDAEIIMEFANQARTAIARAEGRGE